MDQHWRWIYIHQVMRHWLIDYDAMLDCQREIYGYLLQNRTKLGWPKQNYDCRESVVHLSLTMSMSCMNRHQRHQLLFRPNEPVKHYGGLCLRSNVLHSWKKWIHLKSIGNCTKRFRVVTWVKTEKRRSMDHFIRVLT